MKRSPIKQKSSKQAALERAHRAARRGFLGDFPSCWFCGERTTEVHEITRGNGIRNLAFGKRETWAAACSVCNCENLTNYAIWPLERQLCYKLCNDPAYFDLAVICEIRGRAPTAITLEDIVKWLQPI